MAIPLLQLVNKKLGTFYDAKDLAGTGIKVINTDVPGLTLAAAAFDAIESEKMDISGPLVSTIVDSNALHDAPTNMYYLTAIGSYDPLSFKVAIANAQESSYTLWCRPWCRF